MRLHVAHDLTDRELALEVIFLLRDLGHEVTDPIEPRPGQHTLHGIDVLVACVSARASNVYFELGMAVAQKKECLVIARSQADVAANAASLPCVVVGEDVDFYRAEIQAALQRAAKHVNASLDINIAENHADLQQRVVAWFMARGASVEKLEQGVPDLLLQMPGGETLVAEVRAVATPFRVSLEPVRSLRDAMTSYGAQRAVLFTTGSMTRAASELAASQGVWVANPDALFASGSFAEFAERVQGENPQERGSISGQTFGYWFGPREQIPQKPVGNPTGAVLGIDPSWRALESTLALDLVPIDYEWLVLSERGRETYSHTAGMLRGEEWRFVVATKHQAPWPEVYVASLAEPLAPQHIHGRYGAEAAHRARPDAPAVQLRLAREPRT